MASRNERKRRAKARCAALRKAVNEAFAIDAAKRVVQAPKHDVFDVANALRGHRAPAERLGSISRGQFIPAKPVLTEVKRKLIHDKSQGRMIERAIRPSGLKTPRRTLKVNA